MHDEVKSQECDFYCNLRMNMLSDRKTKQRLNVNAVARVAKTHVNPLKGRGVNWSHFAIQV